MNGPDKAWDRFQIKAEVHRRGYTLTQVAQEAGLAESSCRMALLGASRAGAVALSRFLGVAMPELFPGLYLRTRQSTPEATANTDRTSLPKAISSTAGARARA